MFKKFNTYQLLMLLSALFFSCSTLEDFPKADNSIREQEEINPFTIPLEEALTSLEDFFAEESNILTKNGFGERFEIDKVFAISASAEKTKSLSDSLNLLYVVNFKEDNGYALLSADRRIPSPIIAIVENGNASEDDFNESEALYVPTENDDLSIESYYQWIEDGVLAKAAESINLQCKLYAERCILEEEKKVLVTLPDTPINPTNPTTPVTYQWVTIKEVPRLISTAWTQEGEDNLFNKYCPVVGLIWKSKAPAGCVPIAVAQIATFNARPGNLICNGVSIDYSKIKNIYSYNNYWGTGDNVSREMLAQFVSSVGALCKTKYHSIFGRAWGFAWPSDAKYALEFLGHKDVTLTWGYKEELVLASLDKGKPVFMSAVAALFSGHAWVVDGYIKRKYVSNTGIIKKQETLVHCNWGWHGMCNGYFTSGIFHTEKSVISDNLTSKTESEHYWYGFNTITYE